MDENWVPLTIQGTPGEPIGPTLKLMSCGFEQLGKLLIHLAAGSPKGLLLKLLVRQTPAISSLAPKNLGVILGSRQSSTIPKRMPAAGRSRGRLKELLSRHIPSLLIPGKGLEVVCALKWVLKAIIASHDWAELNPPLALSMHSLKGWALASHLGRLTWPSFVEVDTRGTMLWTVSIRWSRGGPKFVIALQQGDHQQAHEKQESWVLNSQPNCPQMVE